MEYQAIQWGMNRVLAQWKTDPTEFQPKNRKGNFGPMVPCSINGAVGEKYSDVSIFTRTNGTLVYVPETVDTATHRITATDYSINAGQMTVTRTVEAKTAEEIEAEQVAALTSAVSAHLDAKAQERNYTNISTACEYAAVPNTFQAESQAYVAWRAACWDHCYQVLADVKAATRTAPTAAELVAELPLPNLPASPVGL